MLVPEFDRYLHERRQGLCFEDNLNDVLMDVVETPFFTDAASPRTPRAFTTPTHSRSGSLTSPPVTTSPLPSTLRPKPKSKWSFLSPRKTPTPTPSTPQPPSITYQPRLPKGVKSLPSTPNDAHYEATGRLKVESLVAESPRKGVWSPAATGGPLLDLAEEDDCGMKSSSPEPNAMPTQVSLSQVLDNVVVRLPSPLGFCQNLR